MQHNLSFKKFIIERHRDLFNADIHDKMEVQFGKDISDLKAAGYKESGYNVAVTEIAGFGMDLFFCVSLSVKYSRSKNDYATFQLKLRYSTSFSDDLNSICRRKEKDPDGSVVLNDLLIPQIEDYEEESEKILRRVYGTIPQEKIEPRDFAQCLGLTIVDGYIVGKAGAMGAFFFDDSSDLVISDDKEVSIRANTIVVNPIIRTERNIGSENNTIIHECIHFLLHWRVFRLVKILGNERQSYIGCYEDGRENDDLITRQIERQAVQLAPRILMNRHYFTKVAEESIDSYKNTIDAFVEAGNEQVKGLLLDADIVDRYVLGALSGIFGVSKLSVKIRLIETGFYFARAARIYIDGHYVRPFWFDKGCLGEKETYTISRSDYDQLIRTDPDFNSLSKVFVFVENHVVPALAFLIELDSETNDYRLTEDGRRYLGSYALKFNVSRKGSTYLHGSSSMSCMLRLPTITVEEETSFSLNKNNRTINYAMEKYREWEKFYIEGPRGWLAQLDRIMEEQGYDITSLADHTGIKYETLRRYINGINKFTNRAFTAVCNVLEIPNEIAEQLIIDSGYLRFDISKPDDYCYKIILKSYCGKGIGECNLFLVSNNVDPFTDNIPKVEKNEEEKLKRLVKFEVV